MVQLLFPLYPVLAVQIHNDCKCSVKVDKSDCCCCDEVSESSNQSYCDMNNISANSRIVPSCSCLIKSVSQTDEVTTQQNYELNKIIAVGSICLNVPAAHSNIIIYKIHSLMSLNGPPIYLSTSVLLI